MKLVSVGESPLPTVGCSYGNIEMSNRIMYEYHAFNVLVVGTVAVLLLANSNLHKFYGPLARLVDFSIVLQFLCAALYFQHHPYSENEVHLWTLQHQTKPIHFHQSNNNTI